MFSFYATFTDEITFKETVPCITFEETSRQLEYVFYGLVSDFNTFYTNAPFKLNMFFSVFSVLYTIKEEN